MKYPKRFCVLAAGVALAASGTLAGCTSSNDTGPGSPDQSNSQNNGATSSNTPHSSDGSEGSSVTKEEAGTIATDKYGGTVKEVESDSYNGKDAWEVEIRDSNEGRIEVKVEKSTGEILHMEHDD